jgi:chromate reductase
VTGRTVVVISGSTRAASTNTAFARTAAAHPPAGTIVTAWTDLTGLPHFDPDLDRDPLPAPVAALRDLMSAADAVVLCTPEYAGALPGAFKNALDWTVGSTVFSDKPVAWIKVAADARRGEGAHAELATVLGYVQARVLPRACTHVPLDRNAVDADGLIADETTVHAVTGAIAAVLAAIDAADTQSR